MTDPYETLATQAVYFCDWPHVCLVLSGDDRAKFLHNVCTADILKLQCGQCCEAFFTNVKGHVLAHGWISARQSHVVVQIFQNDVTELLPQLEKYIIREDVQIDVEENRGVLLVGPTEPVRVAAVSHFEAFDLLGKPAWIVETDQAAATLAEELNGCGYQAGDGELFQTLRIEAGWPLAGVDFATTALPQELNRDMQAISFTKGCYLGQETVARIDALGHVNKLLVSVRFASTALPEPDVELRHSDKPVGVLTSLAWSPSLNAPLGLATIRRPACDVGTTLTSDFGEATVVDHQ